MEPLSSSWFPVPEILCPSVCWLDCAQLPTLGYPQKLVFIFRLVSCSSSNLLVLLTNLIVSKNEKHMGFELELVQVLIPPLRYLGKVILSLGFVIGKVEMILLMISVQGLTH